jgi:hypothetical protein
VNLDKEKIVSKGQHSKDGLKKKPAKTMKEKKAAKREKKSGKMNQGMVIQSHF